MVNTWLMEQFALPDLPQKHIDSAAHPLHTRKEKLMIIAQLKMMNTKVSLALASEIKATL